MRVLLLLVYVCYALAGCARIDAMITGEPVEFQKPESRLTVIPKEKLPEPVEYFQYQTYPDAVALNADGTEYAGFNREAFLILMERKIQHKSNTQSLDKLFDLYKVSLEERNELYKLAQEIEKESVVYQEQLFEAERFIRNRDRIYKVKTWGERIIYVIILIAITG